MSRISYLFYRGFHFYLLLFFGHIFLIICIALLLNECWLWGTLTLFCILIPRWEIIILKIMILLGNLPESHIKYCTLKTSLWSKKQNQKGLKVLQRNYRLTALQHGLPDYWNKWCEHVEKNLKEYFELWPWREKECFNTHRKVNWPKEILMRREQPYPSKLLVIVVVVIINGYQYVFTLCIFVWWWYK